MKRADEIAKRRQINLERRTSLPPNARADAAGARLRMRHTFQSLWELGASVLEDNPTLETNWPDETRTLKSFNKVFHHWLEEHLGAKARVPILQTPSITPEELARREAEFRRLHPDFDKPEPKPSVAKAKNVFVNTPNDLDDVTSVEDVMKDFKMSEPRTGPMVVTPLIEALHLKKPKTYTPEEQREMIEAGKAFIGNTGKFVVYGE